MLPVITCALVIMKAAILAQTLIPTSTSSFIRMSLRRTSIRWCTTCRPVAREGRSPNPRTLKPGDVGEARHVIVKDIKVGPSTEVAILVTHAPAGRLKPHVRPFMDRFNCSGIAVMLVVVADRPLELLPEEIETASGIVVRENFGYRFRCLGPRVADRTGAVWRGDTDPHQ